MKTLIMGILNYTPDSFSDGGRFFSPSLAAEHALQMQEQGADIIDVGCNSTRPGSRILSGAEELDRLKEALEAVLNNVSVPVSVDTFYPECAEYALECGARIINDVSGVFNKEIAALVKSCNAKYAVTHNPCGADKTADYPGGVIKSVRDYFEKCVSGGAEMGFSPENIWLDPGFGFGKSREDNYELLAGLPEIRIEGHPLLVGVSRKRFIRQGDPLQSDYSTSAANAIAVLGGADIIRVHNVSAAAQVRQVAEETIGGQRNG